MCYMYAFHKDEIDDDEAAELKNKIAARKKDEYVFYAAGIFDIDFGY